jgi:hypothetical protein
MSDDIKDIRTYIVYFTIPHDIEDSDKAKVQYLLNSIKCVHMKYFFDDDGQHLFIRFKNPRFVSSLMKLCPIATFNMPVRPKITESFDKEYQLASRKGERGNKNNKKNINTLPELRWKEIRDSDLSEL